MEKCFGFFNIFRFLSKEIQTTVRIFCWVVPTGPISWRTLALLLPKKSAGMAVAPGGKLRTIVSILFLTGILWNTSQISCKATPCEQVIVRKHSPCALTVTEHAQGNKTLLGGHLHLSLFLKSPASARKMEPITLWKKEIELNENLSLCL